MEEGCLNSLCPTNTRRSWTWNSEAWGGPECWERFHSCWLTKSQKMFPEGKDQMGKENSPLFPL